MDGLGLLNFYVPLANFLLFAFLFYLAFRKTFRGMAESQRQRFFRAQMDAQVEKQQAEKQLERVLFEEQELAKKLRGMLEQAQKDSAERAQQILEDARLHADQISQESRRLMDAEYNAKQQDLRTFVLGQLDDRLELGLQQELKGRVVRQGYNRRGLETLDALSVSQASAGGV